MIDLFIRPCIWQQMANWAPIPVDCGVGNRDKVQREAQPWPYRPQGTALTLSLDGETDKRMGDYHIVWYVL